MESSDKQPIFKKWWFWVLTLIVVGVIGKATGSKNSTTQPENAAPSTTAATDQSSTKDHRITLAKFNKIRSGMTRDQVEQIINGTEGVNSRTSDGEDLLKGKVGDDMTNTDLGKQPWIVKYNSYDGLGYAEIGYNSPPDPINQLPTVASTNQSGLK